MNTFLKILLTVILVLFCLHFLPVLLIPVGVAALALLAVGALIAAGLAALLGTGLSLVACVLAVVLLLVAVLAPIWLPVLAIYGLVKLCSRDRKVAA